MRSAGAKFGLTCEVTAPKGSRPPPSGTRSAPGLAADSERSARREFQRRVLRAALIVDGVVLLTLVAAVVAWKLRTVLLLVVISLFLTVLLHPLVSVLERRNVRRGLATGIVFVAGFAILGTVLFVLLHPVVSAAEHLANALPRIIRQAEHGRGAIGRFVADFHLEHYVTAKNGGAQALISRFAKPALRLGKGVLSGVVGVVTIVFLTFFLLIHAPRLYRGVLAWMQPERAERVALIVADVERSVVGYVAGDLATSLVAGVVIAVTLLATGVPYPIVLGVWVAIVDFLPLVGGLLAGVPTVIIATLHSLPAGIVTLLVFLLYQEIENHLLYPIVMSRTVKLNSLWVLVSVLFGAALGDVVGSVSGGFVGALLAVPAGSAVQVVVRDLWRHRTGAELLGVGEEVPVATSGTAGLETGLVAAVRRGTRGPGGGHATGREPEGRPRPPGEGDANPRSEPDEAGAGGSDASRRRARDRERRRTGPPRR
jgi:predicted PurR-regulated permease PerM